MYSCMGCKHRKNGSYRCLSCVSWNNYESNGLVEEKPTDIDKEMKMLWTLDIGTEDSKGKETNMQIKNVIFNYPATIVFWEDDTKTVVKCGDNDVFNPEKGLAMAIAKKALGNKGNYYEVFKKWMPEKKEEEKPREPMATDVKFDEIEGGLEFTGFLTNYGKKLFKKEPDVSDE